MGVIIFCGVLSKHIVVRTRDAETVELNVVSRDVLRKRVVVRTSDAEAVLAIAFCDVLSKCVVARTSDVEASSGIVSRHVLFKRVVVRITDAEAFPEPFNITLFYYHPAPIGKFDAIARASP